MLGDSKEDNFFDDVDTFGDDDSKLSKSQDLEIKAQVKPERHEDDNVVFLAGSLDEQKKENQQTDLVEMLEKMKETLEIPAIFKKNNK